MSNALDVATDDAPVEHAHGHDLVERRIFPGRSQTHRQRAFDTSIGKSLINEWRHRPIHGNLTACEPLTDIPLVFHDFDRSSKFLPVR